MPAKSIRELSTPARASIALAAFFILLFWRWQWLDQRPPKFDESSYLLAGLLEYKALLTGSLTNFVTAYLNADPGRGGLPGLLCLPGFLLFGPSADAAISIFVVFWALAIASLYDATRSIGQHFLKMSPLASATCGFFASLLFATFPETQIWSNTFLVEFPLISLVLACYAASLRYYATGRARWALAVGVALSGCLLAKVTAPAFLAGAIIPIVLRWISRPSWRGIVVSCVLIALPSLMFVAPSFIANWQAILETTRFLSSASVASVYGLGGAWNPLQALEFVWRLLHEFEFLLCVLAAAIAAIAFFVRRTAGRFFLVSMLAAGFLLPLSIVALSNFKSERYAYPGLGMLFLSAGIGLGLLWNSRRIAARVLVALLLVLPFVKTAIVQGMPLPGWLPGAALFPLDLAFAPPDPRNWRIPEIIREVEDLVPAGPIYQLGGGPAFHAALFNFEDQAHGTSRSWTGFPFQLYPNLTAADVEHSAEQTALKGALLYKSPPYLPAFLGQFSAEAVDNLVKKGFTKMPLQSGQPDGSRFYLLKPPFAQVDIASRVKTDCALPGLVVGNQYAIRDVKFVRFGTQLVAELSLQRTGPALPSETIFFHVLDADGKILRGLDRAVCAGCANAGSVTEWTERFFIPDEAPAAIGFGIYTPPAAPSLKITGGPTDWDGLRAVVAIPKDKQQP